MSNEESHCIVTASNFTEEELETIRSRTNFYKFLSLYNLLVVMDWTQRPPPTFWANTQCRVFLCVSINVCLDLGHVVSRQDFSIMLIVVNVR